MSQSLVRIYLHIIFSTKHRRPYLTDRTLQEKVYGYMSGICKNLGCLALKIGGVEDHVHLLTRLSKTLAISDFMRELKRSSLGLAEDGEYGVGIFPLAGWLWCIFSQSIAYGRY